MAITQNHIINIQPGVSAPLVIHCSQGDTGTQINLTVVNGDEEFDCSSYACSVHGVRSDGGNWGPITCTVSGSTVCFSLTSAMTAVAGACLAEISVGTVGTANFAMLMENAIFENGVTYSNDVSVYQNILNAVQAGLSLAEAAVTNEKNERIAAVTNEKNERIEAVTNEKDERVNADNSLSSRISQNDARINNLVGNTGNSNSEIVDARVGVDGISYETLGKGMRTQLTNIINSLQNTLKYIGIFYSIPDSFERKTFYVQDGTFRGTTNRIALIDRQFSYSSITLYTDSGYVFGVHTWPNSDKNATNYLKDSGWQKRYTIPANTYFTLVIKKEDESEITLEEYKHLHIQEESIQILDTVRNNLENIYDALSEYRIPNSFERKTFYVQDGTFRGTTNRIALIDRQFSKFPITLYTDSGYVFGVHTWPNSDKNATNYLKDSGWQKRYTIPANTYFTLVIKKEDESEITLEEYKHLHIQGVSSSLKHTYEGENINLKLNRYDIEELWKINTNMHDGTNNTQSQAFAIYNNVMFQAFNPNKIKTFDFTTGEQLGEFDITIEHGDCLEFSNEMDGDFPLLYATSDSTPMKVYVNKVTKTSSELVRTYKFPSENTGYYGGHCTDFLNKKMYTVGYSNNSYYEDDGTNKMIVCVWDLKKTTTNSDGTITPTLLETFNLPFLITVQGQKFFNGKLFLVSSHYNNTQTIIYIVDPLKKSIVSTVSDLGNYGNIECEDVEFVLNKSKTAYNMIVNVRHTPLLKLSFN